MQPPEFLCRMAFLREAPCRVGIRPIRPRASLRSSPAKNGRFGSQNRRLPPGTASESSRPFGVDSRSVLPQFCRQPETSRLSPRAASNPPDFLDDTFACARWNRRR